MALDELPPVTPPADWVDRDFDAPPGGLSVQYPPGYPLAPYQRLIANPFLAVGVLLGAFGLIVNAVHRGNLALFSGAFGLLLSTPLFLQYHCLDCGCTGHVARASRHACEIVDLRLLSGHSRTVRGPTPANQTKLWAIVLFPILLIIWSEVHPP